MRRQSVIAGAAAFLCLVGAAVFARHAGTSPTSAPLGARTNFPQPDVLSTAATTGGIVAAGHDAPSPASAGRGMAGSPQAANDGTTLSQEVVSHDGGPLPTTTDPTTGETVYVIELGDAQYHPSRMTVLAGTAFVIRNVGQQDHSWTSNEWDSGELAPGRTSEIMFMTLGTYTFHDELRPQLTATVTVEQQSQ
jgi:plastocyanin